MKTAIVYKSFLGTTKKYATWLAEALQADLLTFGQAKDNVLATYDTIIISSGTYAAGMPLVGFIKKKWHSIRDKKVIVVAVGAAPADDPYSRASYEKIPSDIRDHITYFKLPATMGMNPPPAVVSPDNLKDVISHIRG